jgi:RHS repeat-associated protein
LNRLLSISTAPTGTGSGALASAYAYNQANQRLRRTEADDTYWVYEYDNLGQVVSGKRYWAGGVPVAGQQYEYTYDDIGNRKSARQGGNDIGTGLRSASYTANLLNQYSGRTNAPAVDVLGLGTAAATVTVNGGATTRQGAYFWRELAVTNASGPAWTPSTVTATAGTNSTTVTGRLLTPPGTQTLAYDADGNLTNDLVWSYSWDAENRLLAMETLSTVTNPARARVTWDYDPAGRRIRSTVATNWTGSAYSATNETKYLYDGWACIAELTAANALVRQYAWGLDLSATPTGAGGVGGLLWMPPAGGTAHFAAFDGNGNVVALVDGGNGTVSARYDYEPFGATIRMTGTVAKDNAFRFSTKRADDATGIILYEYRPYSPALGRWPNRDPLSRSSRRISLAHQSSLGGAGEHSNIANDYLAFANASTIYADYLGLDIIRVRVYVHETFNIDHDVFEQFLKNITGTSARTIQWRFLYGVDPEFRHPTGLVLGTPQQCPVYIIHASSLNIDGSRIAEELRRSEKIRSGRILGASDNYNAEAYRDQIELEIGDQDKIRESAQLLATWILLHEVVHAIGGEHLDDYFRSVMHPNASIRWAEQPPILDSETRLSIHSFLGIP